MISNDFIEYVPIKKTSRRKDINVILDLDNTLIYSIERQKVPQNKPEWMTKFTHHEMDDDFVVFERPNLQPFLDWLFENFNVTVWSAATPDYVEFIVKNIIENEHRQVEYVLNSNNCEDCQRHYGEEYIKKLDLLWDVHDLENYGPYNTLIIDDLKHVTGCQPNNSIRIKKFISKNTKESINDRELKNVKRQLVNIKKNFMKNINRNNFVLVR